MIRSITVTNYLGDSMKLVLARPELSGFAIVSVDGLGPAKADINTIDVSTNDGAIYNSARLNKRNIVLSCRFVDTLARESVEAIRHKSYKFFPLKRKVRLTIETDTRTAETEGYVESNEPAIFSKQEGCVISIVCPYPYFYSAGQGNIAVLHGIEPTFEFPFSNESLSKNLIEFSSVKQQREQVITYTGDAEIGVTITISAIGEASNIVIYNVGTRELMRIDTNKLATLTGSGVVASDEIIISTVKGNKSITLLRGGERFNILNCLDRDASWFQLVKGDNIFAYTAETGSSNLQFRIESRVIYEGV